MASLQYKEPRRIPDLREMLLASTGIYTTCAAFHEKRDGVYQQISYGKLRHDMEALGTALNGYLPQNARVLVVGKNSYHRALAFLTLICGAGVPIPVDVGVSAEDLAALAREADANAIFYDESAADKLVALPGLTAASLAAFPQLIEEGRQALDAGALSFFEKKIDPAAPAAVFYTSGTTGKAKGVMLSHNNIAFVLMQLAKTQAIEPVDCFLSVLPLSHIYECVAGLLYPLYAGASVAFGEGLHALMRNMREVHPTAMVTIPYLAEAIYKKFWSLAEREGLETQMRRAISISDPVRPLAARQALKERLLSPVRTRFGGALRRMLVVGEFLDPAVQKGLRQIGVFAVQGYGITECAGFAAIGSEELYRDGTLGFALPDSMVDIYNKAQDGSGEIRCKGSHVMLGYYNNQALTDRVLRDGWYYTGDYGKIDEDGFLHLIGRRQNCIERADGNLVSPEELEVMLRQSPFIKDAIVVGFYDEETKDYEPAALIVPDLTYTGEAYGIDFTDEELEGAVGEWVTEMNEGLPQYKQITLFALRETPFPRNAAGRVMRAVLAEEMNAAK